MFFFYNIYCKLLSAVIPIIHGGLQLTTCRHKKAVFQSMTYFRIFSEYSIFILFTFLVYFIFSFYLNVFFKHNPRAAADAAQSRALIFDELLDTFWIRSQLQYPIPCPLAPASAACLSMARVPVRQQRFQLNFHNFPPPTQEQRLMR